MVIQLFDENGQHVQIFCYEDTIWAENQLSENEENTIEHLSIGETAPLEHGWTVKRLS